MAPHHDHPHTAPGAAQPVTTHEIRGGDGVRLHVREWGRADGPEIVFVHGWSQCDLCWMKQTSSDLVDEFRIVTFDLRGHGLSEKPSGDEHYTEGRLWADDLAAVLDQTGLARPVVVAWSYGGFVTCDYLDAYGQERIAGLELVGAAVQMSPAFSHIGPGLLENAQDACAPDLAANIPAIDRFLRACTAGSMPDDEMQQAFGCNMVVPPEVRAALFARELDGRAVIAGLSIPVLIAHGTADQIVLRSMADDLVRRDDTIEVSWYEGIGHMPFWEAPDRFNQELARFTTEVSRRRADHAITSPGR